MGPPKPRTDPPAKPSTHTDPMPHFAISYAYDVPHYADMKIEAATAEDALAKAQALLDSGAFSSITGTPYWDNAGNERVFLTHDEEPLANDDAETFDTAEAIIASHS